MVILSVKDKQERDKQFYVPKKFYDLLKDHQKQALTWLVTQVVHERGSILADEMGLGKTISAISLLVAQHTTSKMNNKVSGPTLVVCPATIIKQWDQEIKAWAQDYLPEVMLYNSQEKNKLPVLTRASSNEFVNRKSRIDEFVESKRGIIITSYD